MLQMTFNGYIEEYHINLIKHCLGGGGGGG